MVIEKTGEVAKSAITALTATPALLVLVIVDIVFILAVSWFLTNAENNRSVERLKLGEIIFECLRQHSSSNQEQPTDANLLSNRQHLCRFPPEAGNSEGS